MPSKVPMAFKSKGIILALENILPLRSLPNSIRSTPRYLRIKASMQEVGIIEPPIVFPQHNNGTYMLLDGHVRLDIAKTLEIRSLFCLIATDDEAFTYNHKVNQLTPVQEHFMIRKAIKNGVSEERIAQTLHVKIDTIKKKRDLLSGICPEAVALLRNRRATAAAIREMKRVKPIRQIEMAELMISMDNYTGVYAQCLVAATPPELVLDAELHEASDDIEPKDLTRLQGEMQNLEREFALVQEEYGQNMLNLVVVVGYLRKLLGNAAVVRFLVQNESEMLAEFKDIVDRAETQAIDCG